MYVSVLYPIQYVQNAGHKVQVPVPVHNGALYMYMHMYNQSTCIREHEGTYVATSQHIHVQVHVLHYTCMYM